MKIFGKKTDAIFDYWSLAHVSFYYIITRLFLMEVGPLEGIIAVLIFSYSWEFLEIELESNNELFKKYLKGKEIWWNRYIGDPLSNLIGFFIAYF